MRRVPMETDWRLAWVDRAIPWILVDCIIVVGMVALTLAVLAAAVRWLVLR